MWHTTELWQGPFVATCRMLLCYHPYSTVIRLSVTIDPTDLGERNMRDLQHAVLQVALCCSGANQPYE
jgi:hypothetical protein